MDIQKLVLATTPHQARLALMILKTLYREAKLYGMTEKNPTIGVKLRGWGGGSSHYKRTFR
jgi:hypothetical protein